MKLHSIQYTEYEEEAYSWNLKDLTLIDINLLVGKNSVGKSRVLRLISGLAGLIDGSKYPAQLETGHYLVTFTKAPNNLVVSYELEIYKNKVKKEVLIVGDEEKLVRGDGGRGKIFFEKQNEKIDVQVPEIQLAVTARRDNQQHSFFEDLYQWSSSSRYYEFASHKDHGAFAIIGKTVDLRKIDHAEIQNNIVLLFQFGKNKYSYDLTKPVLADLRKIGYDITEIGITSVKGLGLQLDIATSDSLQCLYIKEKGVDKRILQHEMSSGLFRALALLIRLHVNLLEKKPRCILVDDIGEGLDFERASKLISVIIEHTEGSHSQLIMTTNDRFVMNKVPLNYWCVVDRIGGNVKIFNPRNTPEVFKEFEEYGFNNFDFFAKEFFLKNAEECES